ncbi:MAG: Serine protease AprX [Bacteroidetes bacterium ADurb.Bin408]|nr:MAG: Serine protease AprX [Bacteroidetes bacterium ADurb.Bin408]
MKFPLIKLLVILSIVLAMAFNTLAQNVFSLSSKAFLNDARPFKDAQEKYILNKDIKEKYALFEKNGISYLSGLAKISSVDAVKQLKERGCIIGSQIGDIISLRVPLETLDSLQKVKGLVYVELGRKIKPLLKDALVDTRADSVHAGISLPQSYTGKNVIIGVTDWGFDYTHPTFYDTSLTNLRIVRAWDQFKESGPAPDAYGYGTVYTNSQELLAAEHDTSNIYSHHTHGTHVSGIAAGSGAGTVYKGFAPDAELAMVTILVDEASVLDAFNFLYDYADSMGKPLVVNMSWGLYYMGTLDGTSLISQSLDYLSDMGVSFVSSAGNNGDVNFHIKKTFNSNDTLRTVVEFEPYAQIPTMWGQSVSMWGTPHTDFKYGIELYDNTNTLIQELPLYNTASADVLDTIVVLGTDTIFYKIEAEASNPFNERPGVRLRVRNLKTNLYKIVVKVVADTGTVHLWNIIELVNDVGNWGAAFSAPIAGFTAGDNNYGIGEPACAGSVIAVGSYRSQVTLPNGNLYYGNISYFSSKGPLISETMKPDITAPGHNVGSALSYFYDGSPVSGIANVNFNGRTYKFGRLSGTSMSSPAAAGTAALIREANPNLTPVQVKALIKQTARKDSITGNIPSTGDVLWGWGKINAYHAVRIASGLSATNSQYPFPCIFKVYPNPAYDRITLEAPEGMYDITITDRAGRVVFNNSGINISNNYMLHLPPLCKGLYIIYLNGEHNNLTAKFIIE